MKLLEAGGAFFLGTLIGYASALVLNILMASRCRLCGWRRVERGNPRALCMRCEGFRRLYMDIERQGWLADGDGHG